MLKAFIGFGIIGVFVNSSIGATLIVITCFLAAVFSEPAICLFGLVATGVIPRTIMWYRNYPLDRMKEAERPVSKALVGVVAFLSVFGGFAATVWFAMSHTDDIVGGGLAGLLAFCIAGSTLLAFME